MKSSSPQLADRGDLSTPPMARGKDEVADALMSLRESLMRLSDLFTAVRQHVRGVAHASSKIASGNEDLAMRTERSAQSIDKLSSLAAFGQKLDECGRLLNDTVPRLQSMRSHSIRSKNPWASCAIAWGVLQNKECGDTGNCGLDRRHCGANQYFVAQRIGRSRLRRRGRQGLCRRRQRGTCLSATQRRSGRPINHHVFDRRNRTKQRPSGPRGDFSSSHR